MSVEYVSISVSIVIISESQAITVIHLLPPSSDKCGIKVIFHGSFLAYICLFYIMPYCDYMYCFLSTSVPMCLHSPLLLYSSYLYFLLLCPIALTRLISV